MIYIYINHTNILIIHFLGWFWAPFTFHHPCHPCPLKGSPGGTSSPGTSPGFPQRDFAPCNGPSAAPQALQWEQNHLDWIKGFIESEVKNNAINYPFGCGANTTYKNGDDWGMVKHGIDWHCFNHIKTGFANQIGVIKEPGLIGLRPWLWQSKELCQGHGNLTGCRSISIDDYAATNPSGLPHRIVDAFRIVIPIQHWWSLCKKSGFWSKCYLSWFRPHSL